MKKFLAIILSVLTLGALSFGGCDWLGEKQKNEEWKNKNILILGDSYSTFNGFIPNAYATWYPNLDVETVEKTWWAILAEETESTIVQNNSWSGSPICYTGYNSADCSKSSSFIYRYRRLKETGFFEENAVDVVFVFGGTNDSWANAPLGGMQYSNWTEQNLYGVLPAICYLTYELKTTLPNAEIVFIANTEIKSEIQQAMALAAEYYGTKCVQLKNISKQDGHPTAIGMRQISDQVMNYLKWLS